MNTWISSTAAAKIAERDAASVASNVSKYTKGNTQSYFILANTWASMVGDTCGPRAAQSLVNYILTHGLLSSINDASSLANDLILQEFKQDSLESDLTFLFNEDPRISLQNLRYPKRFSPVAADKIMSKSVDAFLEVNSSCKGEPYRILYSQGWSKKANGSWKLTHGPVLEYKHTYPSWLIKEVKGVLLDLLPSDEDLSQQRIIEQGYFSTGTTALGSRTLLSKLQEFSYELPNLGSPLYPLGGIWGVVPDTDYVRVVAVPKSYKSARIIAEVPAYKQFCMQGIRSISEQCTKRSKYRHLIILDDQSYNQQNAFIGSVEGTIATIDLSSASDSISHSLARQILSKNWFDALESVNPKWMMVNGTRIRRWIFQTSGNGTTFDFESKIFLAIALVAYQHCCLYYPEDLILPRVYGDDLECDIRCYDTLVDFLGLLGFTVNTDKSFTVPSRYRESCGAEFFCGLDTSTKYFPRKVIDLETAEGWQSLIELQHKLYSWISPDQFLVEYIRSNMKRIYKIDMTSSLPGSECSDLWEAVPFYIKGEAPMVKGGTKPDDPSIYSREGHFALVNKFPKSFKEPVPMRRGIKPYIFVRGCDCIIGDDDILNMFTYQQFLLHGPSFDSSLDELLGVRSKKTSLMSRCYKPEATWLIVYR